ncbi:MAG: SIS domain-containing protein [Bacteroidetes bacterium]|nr:MAG: SIS domain-containing protein [Bacteroidota bacterium]
MQEDIIHSIRESIAVKEQLLKDPQLLHDLELAVLSLIDCYRNGGKVLFCGNGGSAADAQHMAAELSGRFYYDRDPLQAEALHVNSSFVTAVANDYGYQHVFARMVQAWGKKDDILVALSTSGNSENINLAIKKARELQMKIIGFTGSDGGKMSSLCDLLLKVPSQDTPRIQESHILLGHILCEQLEKALFPRF